MITQEKGLQICQAIVQGLTEWPAFSAVLQAGGLEVKTEPKVYAAIEDTVCNANTILVRQYRNIDFAVVGIGDEPRRQLPVEDIIEYKCNYARQLNEIENRVPGAIVQALAYRQLVGELPNLPNCYVLYLIAAPVGDLPDHLPNQFIDSGWHYYNWPLGPAIAQFEGSSAAEAVTWVQTAQAQYQAHVLYCAMLECPLPPNGQI